jgi:adenylate cyclase, class 2
VAASDHIENEVKIRYAGGADEARTLIETRGYREIQPRTLEADRVFDRDSELRRSSQLLRLRREGDRAVVTYKGPPRAGAHKNREEIEFDVSDAGTLTLVLERLGYAIAFRYEKYRTKFAANGEHDGERGIVTIDETPMGIFLELEGPPEWVDATAERLGLSASQYVTASYAKLYQDYRRANPNLPADMVFEE